MATHAKDLAAQKFEAEIREAEARLELMRAQSEGRNAKQDMDEVSGLTAAKDRVKNDIADLKRKTGEQYETAKRAVERGIEDLKADMQRVGERFTAWDDASDRRFTARLDEAEARLKVWKAQADQKRAERGMKRHDALATLEENIALARASSAEARHEKYSAKAQAALEDAVDHFQEAYEAAATRYEQK